MKYNKSRQSGFTLIEAMVALVVLTVGMGPLLYLSNTSVNVAYGIRDEVTASNLTQEGIEVVRAIRGANWLNSRAFDAGLSDGSYRVQWDSTSLIALGANPALKLSSGQYNYAIGTPTPFSRIVTITKINAGELRVVSQVSWAVRGGTTKVIQAEDHLFNWK